MIRVTDKQYFMDEFLLTPLNTMAYNISNGHDFMLLITGSAKKRVGKTMLATQIAYYLASILGTKFDESNIAFGGTQLIDVAKSHPQRSVIIDDEANKDISAKRQMESMNKDLMDFFRECGKLNDIIILIAPDFFEFSKSIAVNLSDMLINIRRDISKPINLTAKQIKDSGLNLPANTTVVKIERGYWDFYNSDDKKKLYIWGKQHFDEYNINLRSFHGSFNEFWPIDRDKYEARKDSFIFRDRNKPQSKRLVVGIKNMLKEGMTQRQVAEVFEVSQQFIAELVSNK